MTPNVVGITGWVLLVAGVFLGTTPPPLTGRTLLALTLITLGGALLCAVAGRHHQGPQP